MYLMNSLDEMTHQLEERGLMSVNPAFANWFVGFVDGEGCFLYQEGQYKACLQIQLRDDDLPVLLEIQQHLQMGNICHLYPTENMLKNTPGAQPVSRLAIYRKADCWALVLLFDEYPLRTKKAHDYTVWREIVLEIQKKPSMRDHPKLAYLADKLKLVRQYSQPAELQEYKLAGSQLELWTDY